MNETVCTKICGHFAQIQEYPPPSLQELTKECIVLEKIVGQMDGRINPYGGCFRSCCSHSKMDGEMR
jgi:hypothetical protein